MGIWLTTRRLLICWPVVLAADIFYLVVFYRARLFSDAILQIFFVAFTLYGWWHWWRGVRQDGEVRVVPLSMRGWFAGLIAGAIGALLLGSVMVRIGAALPHLDAALTSYSLVASWWQARKYIANWWLWIAMLLGLFCILSDYIPAPPTCTGCGQGVVITIYLALPVVLAIVTFTFVRAARIYRLESLVAWALLTMFTLTIARFYMT